MHETVCFSFFEQKGPISIGIRGSEGINPVRIVFLKEPFKKRGARSMVAYGYFTGQEKNF